MTSHLRYRRVGAVATAAVLTFALAACGSDAPEGGGGEAGGSGETTSTPSPTPSGLTGDWAADPGQADRVQDKLTAAGFECTKSTDPELDLRMCSLGVKAPAEGRVAEARVRYVADAEGTVVLANVTSYGPGDDAREKTIAEAVLPAADAAVYVAEGETLEWGQRVDAGDRGTYLAVKGWSPDKPLPPTFKPLATTKEKALPVLQKAKLTCKFSDRDTSGEERQGLACVDPSFEVKNEDRSMSGARAELVLLDNGEGVVGLRLEGGHSKTSTENARGVKQLVPAAKSVDPDQGLQDAAAWILQHLDTAPHSAYVGQWRVELDVVPSGGLVGYPFVRASLDLEDLNLGLKAKDGNWAEVPTDSPTASDSVSPNN